MSEVYRHSRGRIGKWYGNKSHSRRARLATGQRRLRRAAREALNKVAHEWHEVDDTNVSIQIQNRFSDERTVSVCIDRADFGYAPLVGDDA